MDLENWEHIKKCLLFSNQKLRPEISEESKAVRKRIFYAGSVSFLILTSYNSDFKLFDFNISHKNAFIFMFIGMMYFLFHFIYELFRDFSGNRAKWTGASSGIESAKTYIEQNITLINSLNSSLGMLRQNREIISDISPNNRTDVLNEIKRLERDIRSEIRNTQSDIFDKLQYSISRHIDISSESNSLSQDIKELAARAGADINSSFIQQRLDGYLRALEDSKDSYKTHQDSVEFINTKILDIERKMIRFFPYQKRIIFQHKYRFLSFIITQWFFEAVLPILFATYILYCLSIKYSTLSSSGSFIFFDALNFIFLA